MTPQPQQNIIDKMMQEYDCIFYPMCVKARELLYCPKKVGKSDCEDYRSRPAPSPTGYDSRSRAYLNGYTAGAAQARNDFIEKAEHLAQTIPDFNRMDYIHLLKESLLTGGEPR